MTMVDLSSVLDEIKTFTPTRYPVLNHEPREPISARKWHLIWERDGNTCWMCMRRLPKGGGQVDHVIPRSSFASDDLDVADRSDNLRVACVDCNQDKSNFTTLFQPRPIGVSAACVECSEFDEDCTTLAYCGRCGVVSRVPDERWLM